MPMFPIVVRTDTPFRTPTMKMSGSELFRILKARDPTARKRDFYEDRKWDKRALMFALQYA